MRRYNLVLFHRAGSQHVSDFLTIRNMMHGPARDIDVHIVSLEAKAPAEFWAKIAEIPTLLFSPVPINVDPTIRGTRLVSTRRTKSEEYRMLMTAGLPVPELVPVEADTRLEEASWGRFTVLKPFNGEMGRGVSLVRTRDVKWTHPASLPQGDYRRGRTMLAQRFIDTGPYVRCTRVFTVLGEAIYSVTSTATDKAPVLPDPSGNEPIDIPISANGGPRRMTMNGEQDIIDLGVAVHRKFPDIPTMGVDIVREHATGKLFVLELNTGGLTWHVSSNYGLRQQRDHGLDYYSQFDALGTIAEALIETTRARAS